MKSIREAAKTRTRIVTAAAAEFREHGIVATGLADLMRRFSTMIGAVTMSRVVTNAELSADILREAAKSLKDG